MKGNRFRLGDVVEIRHSVECNCPGCMRPVSDYVVAAVCLAFIAVFGALVIFGVMVIRG